MNKVNAKRESKLHCPLEEVSDILFFSLVDYRNNYFTNNDPKKIIEFYNGFENRDQLIQWMRERPKGAHTIREVEGDKDIIVVIPTADFNGKFAKECRENIFKGLHTVFVESGVDNYYFNYAHNCNVGINKAMEYNPKWVVVSNDDMKKIDEVEVLKRELDKLDNEKVNFVVCEPSYGYHSTPVKILYLNKLGLFLYIHRSFKNLSQSLNVIVNRLNLNFIFTPIDLSKTGITKIPRSEWFKLNILTKFIFHDSRIRLIQIGAFGIFSGNLVNKLNNKPYNEDYINAVEDIDLSYRFLKKDYKISMIQYNILPAVGGTLGNDTDRDTRSLLGRFYLFSMMRKEL